MKNKWITTIMKSRFNQLSGSITIFLTLCITITLSVIFIILESARLVSLRTYYTDVSYLALDSLSGSYCRELWDDYGLLAINTSDINVDETMSKYITDNISGKSLADLFSSNYNLLKGRLNDISITNHTYLTDDAGTPFSNQVLSYMKYASIENTKKLFDSYFSNERIEVYNFSDKDYVADSDKISNYEKDHPKDTSECLELDDDDAKDFYKSLSDSIAHHIQKNTLLLLVDDPTSISNVEIKKETLPSVSCLSDEAVFIANGYLEDSSAYTLERIVLEEYISTHFGCYTNPSPNSKLKYELEYILMGDSHDDQNLFSVATHLIILRASFNSSYILSNPAKYTAADELTRQCMGLLYGTPFSLITKYTIISLWATAEAFIDVRDLFAGKKVPLIKDKDTWSLDLSDALNLSKSTKSKNDGTDGLSYIDYIKVLLIAENELALRYRTMDLIQLNMRHKYNNTFNLSNCLSGFDTNLSFAANNIFLNLSKEYIFGKTSLFNISMKYNYN